MSRRRVAFIAAAARAICATSLLLIGCSSSQVSPRVSEAQTVADSKAAKVAKKHAPQVFFAAEKLRAEAEFLQDEGRQEEASAAAEEAMATYELAFTLARAAIAEERIERATQEKEKAEAEQAELDRLTAEIARDAEAYELQARVHLDQEAVKDVESPTTERLRARRSVARHLAAEARTLCLAARLLEPSNQKVAEAEKGLGELETHLEHGSVRQDIYPRATDLRIRCLEELTAARRENIRKTPNSTESDELLTSLARTGSVMVYRDDRGVVVNLGAPLDDDGEIREASRQALALLGATAKRHPQFPVMLIAHTANPKDDARGAAMLETSERIMKDNGAKTVASHSVKDAAPVVHPKLNGATTKNERLEVIFVSPGR